MFLSSVARCHVLTIKHEQWEFLFRAAVVNSILKFMILLYDQ
jgi:hypothetical protein